ncbi:polysaccharide lyase [Parvularcula sp. LCG005]|uniref:polysaccharide lyase n=1 Tax=Parvularcula sp. LCG005 TaxID=3078805 RepID=UPI0029425830|nr:hypothetical protein [Parvularcula sp. LCG005]WOI53671.1 hypothetical protein RUI03_01430 [Parvularcula sp. LCG005]
MDLLPCAASVPIAAEDFEDASSTAAALMTHHPNLSVIKENGQHVLQSNYVGDAHGSERNYANIPLKDGYEELSLSFDVKFEKDFPFVRGGKMHGFVPDRSVTGGQALTPEGWSARIMWGAEGVPLTYTYHQDQPGKYGEIGTALSDAAFPTDEWFAVTLHTRLNTEDGTPGFTRLYLNGTPVREQTGLTFRSVFSPESLISRFVIVTFHGGNDPSWAPKNADGSYRTVQSWFDNIAIYDQPCRRMGPVVP